jgi:hypothetical protein
MRPTASPLGLAAVPVLWGLLGFVHAAGAPLPVMCLVVGLAAGLGLAIAQLALQHTGWTSLLAAALLATSPVLQKYWVLPRQAPASETLAFLKTLLVLGGLLMLACLEAAGGRDRDSDGDDS